MRPHSTTLPPDLDSHFLAWLAGFIDGEGCFSVGRSRFRNGKPCPPSHHLQLAIGNTSRDPLDEIASTLGVGTVTSQWRPTNRTASPIWSYRASGTIVQAIAAVVLPYLRVKREHARLCLEFPIPEYHYAAKSNRRPAEMVAKAEEVYLSLKAINVQHAGAGRPHKKPIAGDSESFTPH